MIHEMNHFTVLSDDLEQTLKFYVDGLGLATGPRPDLGFPGAWLYAGGRPILHIVAGRELPLQRAGVIDHMAFSAHDLQAVKTRLDAMGIHYDLRRQRESNAWQLFCFDPSGARVELDFAASESD